MTDNPTFDKIKIDYRICDNRNGAKAMTKGSNKESIFLNEHLMAVVCVSSVITGAASLFLLSLQENNYLAIFGLVIKLITTATMFFAFRHYNWDVTKGLMGGVFFSLMYEEAYLVLGKLWSEQDFDVYLVVGVQGSLYLAAAGMSFLMTIVITINHFIINYAIHGNPENVIFNRMAIIFKFIVYIILIVTNSMLGLSASGMWANALMYLTDMAILIMLICIESQFDSFNLLRHELLNEKRERNNNK